MELRLLSPYGMFHVSGAGDVLSHSNGFNGDIGFIQSIEFGPLELLPPFRRLLERRPLQQLFYGGRKPARAASAPMRRARALPRM